MQKDEARTTTGMTIPKATLIGPTHNTTTNLLTCSRGLSKETYKDPVHTNPTRKQSFPKTSSNYRGT